MAVYIAPPCAGYLHWNGAIYEVNINNVWGTVDEHPQFDGVILSKIGEYDESKGFYSERRLPILPEQGQ